MGYEGILYRFERFYNIVPFSKNGELSRVFAGHTGYISCLAVANIEYPHELLMEGSNKRQSMKTENAEFIFPASTVNVLIVLR
jgi:hypothetical protein